jgi:hypothetical protein
MNTFATPHEAPEPVQPRRRGRRLSRAVTRVLSGEFLTREEVVGHIPFLLYVCGFFIISIAVGYSFDNTERAKVKLRTQLKELNAEYKTLKTALETRKQHSNVARQIEAIGLEEATTPPVIIEITRRDLEKQH